MDRSAVIAIILFGVISHVLSASNLFINQSGYLPEGNKYVYSAGQSVEFALIDKNSGNIVYQGNFNTSPEFDELSSLTLRTGDFSDYNAEGNYYIVTDDSLVTPEFRISKSVYEDISDAALKGFYLQRCGMQLIQQYAGEYNHNRCHFLDGMFHSSTGLSGFNLSSGGWHDAGDYGKYVINAGVTVGTLLLGYDLFPEKFSFDDLNIPESGNGIPDILDEVIYELEWLVTMQGENGGVFTKLTPEQFSGFVKPEQDNQTRYIFEVSSAATADFAAMMAMASRILSRYKPDLAAKYKTAALNAWEYLIQNPQIVPVGGFHNPAGTNTGEYGDSNDKDERLWASVELFRLTGEQSYDDYFQLSIGNTGLIDGSLSWQNVKNIGLISYLYSDNGNTDVKDEIKSSLTGYCDYLKTIISERGFKLAMNDGDFNWGSNSAVMNKALLLIVAADVTGNSDYSDNAQYQLDYILGCNGHDLSFVTGTGSNRVMNPHHRPSVADNIEEPVPGLLAGGPNQNLQDDILLQYFDDSTPPAMCYVDHVDSYASNEIAINWNAPLVFVSGYFRESVPLSVSEPDQTEEKKSYLIPSNYPNPFNGTTIIKYYTENESNGKIKIYDLTGRLVHSDLLNSKSGENFYTWNSSTNAGLTSGIYFYTILTENNAVFNKMVLLK